MKTVQRFVMAVALLLMTASTAAAAGPQWCANTSWSDYTSYASGDFLEGGNRYLGIGGKGAILQSGEIVFDTYQSGVGYLGSANVDAQGNLTLSGGMTQFEVMSIGYDCNQPAALYYIIKATVNGVTFWVRAY